MKKERFIYLQVLFYYWIKKFLKYSFFALLLLLILVVFYYTIIVVKARIDTPEIVTQYLNSEKMQLEVSDLSKRQLKILLLVEDPNFYEHKGIDLNTPGAGLTTISQAVVKKLYFNPFRPGIRKIKQILIAYFAFDPLVKKDDQLKLFINLIGFGHGTVGFEQAAYYYFNKSFKKLNKEEYISLVAMIIAPKTFNIKDNPGSNRERVKRIKLLITGKYKPKGLMDLYYGKLSKSEQQNLAPMSYFEYDNQIQK